MKTLLKWRRVFLCSVMFTNLLNFSKSFPSQDTGLKSLADFAEVVHEESEFPNQNRGSRVEPEKTLISFLQTSVKKYGEKKVASSIHELAQRSMYDLMWMLAGDLEPWLIVDLYKVYAHANSDASVQSVYERFKAGKVNRTIVPEVFALDKKYNQYEWWRRVRTRMLDSVDKYIAGNLKVTNPPPQINFTPDGQPIIGAGPQIGAIAIGSNPPVSSAAQQQQILLQQQQQLLLQQQQQLLQQQQIANANRRTTEDPNDEDPDDEDSEDSDLGQLFASLI